MASSAELDKLHETLKIKHFGSTDQMTIIKNAFPIQQPPAAFSERTKMTFPYYASGSLPAPLPTVEDIEKARGTKNDLTLEKGNGLHFVYRVNEVYAVKFALDGVILQEAENLLFVENNSRIRIPKLYACFSHQGGDPLGWLTEGYKRSDIPTYHYLVLEYIPGQDLDGDFWPTLNLETKRNISHKLGEQLRLLREIPAPSPTFYGRVYDQPFEQQCPMFMPNSKQFHGPYRSHKEFLDAMYNACERNATRQYALFDQAALALKAFYHSMNTATDQESRFTYFDFQLHNVRITPREDNPDDPDITIVDWDAAYWMPGYVQAALALGKGSEEHDEHMVAWELSRAFDNFPLATAKYLVELFGATYLI